MDGDLTENGIKRLLFNLIKKEGNHERAAQALGVSRSLISYIVEGKKGIGPVIANALGYDRVIVYRKKKD